MPSVVQVCIVVVTVAMVVVAFMAVRLFLRVETLTQSVTDGVKEIKELLDNSKHTRSKVEELLGILGGIGGSLRSAAARVENVAERAERISTTVLDEVEGPVRQAAALVHGLRTGTESLARRWANR